MGAVCSALLGLSLVATALTAFWLGSCVAAGVTRRAIARMLESARVRIRRLARRLNAIPRVKTLVQRRRQQRHREQMRREMPEAVRLLCIALDSGSSLVQALDYAADNTDGALGLELSRVVWDLEAGQGFSEAMENLRARTGGSEFAYLAIAMEIQHVCGGSLGAVLESVSESLHASAELEEEFASKTAQARLSARVVAIMPLALLAVVSLFSPGYLATFFSSVFGVILFVCGLILEAAGIMLVRRCLVFEGATMGGAA